MITIDGHTFDDDLLTGGWVIDAGCRGFEFSRQLLIKDENVVAIDIENFERPDFNYPSTESILKFKHAALSNFNHDLEAYYFGNGTGNFVKGINQTPENTIERPCITSIVRAITLDQIYKEIGTDIDLLKLDIEGSEYQILEYIEPIPKQITVEFHEHVHPILHKEYIDKVMTHLCKYYHCNLYIREWPLYHYMDCLFIRKDLL